MPNQSIQVRNKLTLDSELVANLALTHYGALTTSSHTSLATFRSSKHHSSASLVATSFEIKVVDPRIAIHTDTILPRYFHKIIQQDHLQHVLFRAIHVQRLVRRRIIYPKIG